MSELVAWLKAQLDEDEDIAEGEHADECAANLHGLTDAQLYESSESHIQRCSCPVRRRLLDVVAKRALLAEIADWRHLVVDGDCWYSCAQAADEDGHRRCCDSRRVGGPCDCGLDWQRDRLVRLLAAPYADRPGYRDEWRPQ